MRLFVCGVSTLLLSACSMSGLGIGGLFGGGGDNAYAPSAYNQGHPGAYGQGAYQNRGPRNVARSSGGHPNCMIQNANQPIPAGCSPDQVTFGLGSARSGGTNGAQYTNAGYGNHAANAGAHAKTISSGFEAAASRPKLRGTFGFEFDKSFGGNLYSPINAPSVAGYDRSAWQEGHYAGSIGEGTTTSSVYTSSSGRTGRVLSPDISFDDVYSAPFRLSGGAEYIMNDHATVFGNVGYTHSEGKSGGGVSINEELLRETEVRHYVTDPLVGTVGDLIQTIPSTAFVPGQTVANFNYTFNDMKRFDVELGGRYYFSPVLSDKTNNTLTPFVSGSAGMAHYNETRVRETQTQRYLRRAFEGTEENSAGDFYAVNYGEPTAIYDAQWVPYGALKAGVEYQVSPKVAIALETGLKYEGARDFSDGTDGDGNLTVPVSIRGSFNF